MASPYSLESSGTSGIRGCGGATAVESVGEVVAADRGSQAKAWVGIGHSRRVSTLLMLGLACESAAVRTGYLSRRLSCLYFISGDSR